MPSTAWVDPLRASYRVRSVGEGHAFDRVGYSSASNSQSAR